MRHSFDCETLPRGERRVAVLMPDYPGAPGRAGYAVGLDVPASVIAALDDLAAAGYGVTGAPKSARDLLDTLSQGSEAATLSLDQYRSLLTRLPDAAARALAASVGRSHE